MDNEVRGRETKEEMRLGPSCVQDDDYLSYWDNPKFYCKGQECIDTLNCSPIFCANHDGYYW